MGTPKIQIAGDFADRVSRTEMNAALDGKMDKITNKTDYGKVLYFPGQSSTPTAIGLDTRVLEGGVVRRKFEQHAGHIELPDLATNPPTLPNLAVSKAYVDKKIDKIEGMLIDYIEDSTEAYSKSVPTKAAPKAMLNSVGGKTWNGLPREFPITFNLVNEEENGGVESYFIGEFLAGTYEYTVEHNGNAVRLECGASIIDDPASGTFTLAEKSSVYITDYLGSPFNTTVTVNITSLNLFPTKVTEIISRGRNLAKCTGWSASGLYTPTSDCQTSNSYGTTIDTTVPDANTIEVTQSVVGKPDDIVSYQNGYIIYRFADKLKEGFTYTISFDINIKSNPANATYISVISSGNKNGKAQLPANGKGRVFTDIVWEHSKDHPQKTTIDIRCMGMSFTVGNVMITEPSNDITYSPYIAAEPYALPEAVVNDADWGISVGDVANTYNFDSKEYSKPIKRLVLTGNEIVGTAKDTGASFSHFYVEVSGELKAIGATNSINLRCSHYNEIEREKLQRVDGTKPYASAGSNYFRFVDPELLNGDHTDFKAKLKRLYDAGNPVIVDYILATPEIKNITDKSYTDYKFLKVEGDGELIAKNENETETAIPWTVTFAEV